MTRGGYLTAARLAAIAGQLSVRDLLVLKTVAELRFMTGDQVTRLHFSGDESPDAAARAARRALLRLHRWQVLDRLPRVIGGLRAGSAGFVYCLGVAGQHVAVLNGWHPERRPRRSLTPGQLFLDHTLQIAELHVRLRESERSRRFEVLELAAEPTCWRSYGGSAGSELLLKPDSAVRLGFADCETSHWIEVDRGTEGSRAIDAQLGRYLAYYRTGIEEARGGVFPHTLWLVPNRARRAVIDECIGQLASPLRMLFGVGEFDDAIDAFCAYAEAI